LEEIQTIFPGAKVSQVYASTEFGSITSVRDGKPGLAVDSLWSESNPASNVRVADGELWVRAGAGMLGYAGESPTASASADADEAGDWRRTGDLVEIVDDRVMFRGRKSEVINVGGVKVHPLPVEDRITGLDSVALARVFGRPNKLTGAIVAAEIVPVGGVEGTDVEAIRVQIKEAVADLPRAWQPRSVTFVDAIETKGGKTIRGMED
jgi:acyl-CoA synthetase (AMP-forming)/AMP-acid ligase II